MYGSKYNKFSFYLSPFLVSFLRKIFPLWETHISTIIKIYYDRKEKSILYIIGDTTAADS